MARTVLDEAAEALHAARCTCGNPPSKACRETVAVVLRVAAERLRTDPEEWAGFPEGVKEAAAKLAEGVPDDG